MALSSLVTMLLSCTQWFGGPFFSALEPVAAIFGFAALGRLIEERVLGKMSCKKCLIPIVPAKIRVLRGGKESTIDANAIATDDRFQLRAGETVAVDAIVETGELFLDERALWGKSVSQSKKAGDRVPAGAFVIFGEAVVLAQTVPSELFAARPFDSTETLKAV